MKKNKVYIEVVDGVVFKRCIGPCNKLLEENKENFSFRNDSKKFRNKCIDCRSLSASEYHKNQKINPRTPKNINRTFIDDGYFKNCLGQCGRFLKEIDENFYFKPSSQKYLNKCRECVAEDSKQYNIINEDYLFERRKEYRSLNKDKLSNDFKEYYEENKETICADKREYYKNNKNEIAKKSKIKRTTNLEFKEEQRVYRRNYKKDRREKDVIFRLREHVSTQIRQILKYNNGSKNGQSIFDHLPYTFDDFVSHFSEDFEYKENNWMNWDKWGVYIEVEWDDNDPSTWRWNIDHIIPQSQLPFDSLDHPNFKKCWALENLRPYSAKQNVLEGNRRSAEKIEEIKRIRAERKLKK